MNIRTTHGLLVIITSLIFLFLAGFSFADSPNSSNEENGQMMYPYGMHRGMGPGNMPYGGMAPGNMPYGNMGPGYMHQGRGGYGGMGYGMGYGMGMMGYGGMGMMRALDLNKEQRNKLRGLLRAQRTAHCQSMNEMLDVRDQLAAEYDKPEPNAKAIGRLYDKMAGLQKHMLEQSVQMHNKMRELLNKDQKQRFDRMFHSGMGYGGMGMMNMMGGGMMGYHGMMNMME